jgi:hypothetical protein
MPERDRRQKRSPNSHLSLRGQGETAVFVRSRVKAVTWVSGEKCGGLRLWL